MFPPASDGVLTLYIVIPDLFTRMLPTPLNWREETVAPVPLPLLALLPPFEADPKPAAFPPDEPHAVASVAATASHETAAARFNLRCLLPLACAAPTPGRPCRVMPAMMGFSF
jgi:hypothetical protein